MRNPAALLAAASVLAIGPAFAETVRWPSPGGEIILPSADDVRAHDTNDFAALRQAGDILYVSGAVVRRRAEEGSDLEAFKGQVRRAFRRLEVSLKPARLDFADVALINTFHMWNSPDYAGDSDAQSDAFLTVKREFMGPPHAAWTAVGTTGLLGAGGIVEIQVIVHNTKSKAGSKRKVGSKGEAERK